MFPLKNLARKGLNYWHWGGNEPCEVILLFINTLRPRQNGCHFADDIFNRIFVNEDVTISIKFSLKFVPKGPINNIPALVQIMAWRRPGDKPSSEPVMVSLLMHICVTQPQWVNYLIGVVLKTGIDHNLPLAGPGVNPWCNIMGDKWCPGQTDQWNIYYINRNICWWWALKSCWWLSMRLEYLQCIG